MPSLFSLPYELRDEIYKHVLSEPLPANASRSLLGSRKRVSKQPPVNEIVDKDVTTGSSTKPMSEAGRATDTSTTDGSSDDVGYYAGEENIRYPLTTPPPPGHSLLRASRQIRTELLDKISRTPIRYKIHLAFREDTETVYPSWVFVPAFSNRVDVLDVELRFRPGKTSSLCSASSDDQYEQGDPFEGSLALLERFLERGVDFLSTKKKGRKITVGLLAVTIVLKGIEHRELQDWEYEDWLKEFASRVDDWFSGGEHPIYLFPKELERADQLTFFLAERIDRFSIQVKEARKEWDMKALLAERKKSIEKRERGDALQRSDDSDS